MENGGIIPLLALATFLIFLVYLVIMKKKTSELRDKETNSALATGGDPAERTQH